MRMIKRVEIDEAMEILKSGEFVSIDNIFPERNSVKEYRVVFDVAEGCFKNDMKVLAALPEGFASISFQMDKRGYKCHISVLNSSYDLRFDKDGVIDGKHESKLREIIRKLDAFEVYSRVSFKGSLKL